MKKIPTLFVREFENHRVVKVTDQVTKGLEWVLEGEGVATVKIDGSCCAIIDGKFYKRYDAKKGKTPPAGAIPCCDPDPITGHWPHWVLVDENNPSDKWFIKALKNYSHGMDNYVKDGTYEATGVHFNNNPHDLSTDTLIPHGVILAHGLTRTFEGIKDYLCETEFEGIVFWKDGEPQCKIKRSDFGFEWPVKKEC